MINIPFCQLVKEGMERDGVYERFDIYYCSCFPFSPISPRFQKVIEREWGEVFGEVLSGENYPFVLPSSSLPFSPSLVQFTQCQP